MTGYGLDGRVSIPDRDIRIPHSEIYVSVILNEQRVQVTEL
jgi:hypothetical protein